ncbi:F0F1 ATP synthase subunit epsilon [Spiroplasma endosymbiont of Zeiraphera isertana]|uniref:F0F1 ATP synthase subunit epsilon n=1 Tax=Spiroplasma endosymbiont of Zeiraphera isertana TaxID=3066313 RepID=UPI00313EA0FB
MALNLKIITPDGIFFDGEVQLVNVKTTEGYVGILEWHTPLIANIQISKMSFKIKEKIRNLTISGGLLVTDLHMVRIISDKVEYTSMLKEQETKVFDERIKRVSGG